MPALSQAVHWRNRSKAFGSFRGTPTFSGAFQTEPLLPGGGFPVAEHFNLPEHNQVHDMRVSLVTQVKGGTATRQREERRLIFQLSTLVPGGLNIDVKFFLIRLQNRDNVHARYLSSASTP